VASAHVRGTYTQFDVSFRAWASRSIRRPGDPENFARHPSRRAPFTGETIANPRMNVLDIEKVAAIAHEAGVPR